MPPGEYCHKTRKVRNLEEKMEQQNPSQPPDVTEQLLRT